MFIAVRGSYRVVLCLKSRSSSPLFIRRGAQGGSCARRRARSSMIVSHASAAVLGRRKAARAAARRAAWSVAHRGRAFIVRAIWTAPEEHHFASVAGSARGRGRVSRQYPGAGFFRQDAGLSPLYSCAARLSGLRALRVAAGGGRPCDLTGRGVIAIIFVNGC